MYPPGRIRIQGTSLLLSLVSKFNPVKKPSGHIQCEQLDNEAGYLNKCLQRFPSLLPGGHIPWAEMNFSKTCLMSQMH